MSLFPTYARALSGVKPAGKMGPRLDNLEV